VVWVSVAEVAVTATDAVPRLAVELPPPHPTELSMVPAKARQTIPPASSEKVLFRLFVPPRVTKPKSPVPESPIHNAMGP